MRITFIIPVPDLSGGSRVVAIYAQRLAQRGHRVTVVGTPGRSPSLKGKLKLLLKEGHWPCLLSKRPTHFEGRDIDLRIIDRCRAVCDADVPDADIVIATWWETAEWAANLSARKGTKVYFVQHHEVHPGLPIERVKATYRLPLHKITISKWLFTLMATEYQDYNVSLVPNSVDTTVFQAPQRSKQAIPTIGMLYSRSSFKRCELGFDAFRRARSIVRNLRMVTFGAQRVSAVLPLPQGSEFVFQPPQSEIRKLYAKCDLWMCSSRTEGFYLPLLEAMACRCPVLSTPVGGPLDVIRQNENGWLVKGGDTNALAERILETARMSSDRWQTMSDSAYFTAASYTWDDATTLFAQALETAVRQKKKCPVREGTTKVRRAVECGDLKT